MENPKAAVVERLQKATNVLVTVSMNPSVDQLAGAIGLTLLLNKLDKHATAVFSGNVPSTLEFLRPDQTLEKTTDSLRDFIIALDRGKADKLRYKVEEKLVKIFITPYHTSIGQDDLEFSLGDFNVDVVVALGVHEQKDLDQAITAHGRILHDASIITINTQPNGNLGTITWVNTKASSLCEMLTDLGATLKGDVFDAQMSTALLTGIVAETARFSNQKTTSETMNISAKLMAAGANQQLVATKLEAPPETQAQETTAGGPPPKGDQEPPEKKGEDDGALRIDHDNAPADNVPAADEIQIDEHGELSLPEAKADEKSEKDTANVKPPEKPKPDQPEQPHDTIETHVLPNTPKLVLQPPTLGGPLTAATLPDRDEVPLNPLTLPPVDTPILSHDSGPAHMDDATTSANAGQPQGSDSPQTGAGMPPSPPEPTLPELPAVPPPPPPPPAPPDETLTQLEKAVESPHTGEQNQSSSKTSPDLDAARDAVSAAVASGGNEGPLEPVAALGAQPVDLDLGHEPPQPPINPLSPAAASPSNQDYLDISKLDENTGLPRQATPPTDQNPVVSPLNPSVTNPLAPPPVPPPMMPPPAPMMQFGEQPLPNHEDDNQPQDPLAPL